MSCLLTQSQTGWLNSTEKVSASDIALYATLVKLVGDCPIYPDLTQKIAGEWKPVDTWYKIMQKEFPDFDPLNPALKPDGKCKPAIVQKWKDAPSKVQVNAVETE